MSADRPLLVEIGKVAVEIYWWREQAEECRRSAEEARNLKRLLNWDEWRPWQWEQVGRHAARHRWNAVEALMGAIHAYKFGDAWSRKRRPGLPHRMKGWWGTYWAADDPQECAVIRLLDEDTDGDWDFLLEDLGRQILTAHSRYKRGGGLRFQALEQWWRPEIDESVAVYLQVRGVRFAE